MPEIQKNAIETLKVQLTEYKGHELVDIRVYYRTANDELAPTRKGVTISPALIPWLKTALEEIEREYQAKKKGG